MILFETMLNYNVSCYFMVMESSNITLQWSRNTIHNSEGNLSDLDCWTVFYSENKTVFNFWFLPTNFSYVAQWFQDSYKVWRQGFSTTWEVNNANLTKLGLKSSFWFISKSNSAEDKCIESITVFMQSISSVCFISNTNIKF